MSVTPIQGTLDTRELRCPNCRGITVLRDAIDRDDYGPGEPRQQYRCVAECGWHSSTYTIWDES